MIYMSPWLGKHFELILILVKHAERPYYTLTKYKSIIKKERKKHDKIIL